MVVDAQQLGLAAPREGPVVLRAGGVRRAPRCLGRRLARPPCTKAIGLGSPAGRLAARAAQRPPSSPRRAACIGRGAHRRVRWQPAGKGVARARAGQASEDG